MSEKTFFITFLTIVNLLPSRPTNLQVDSREQLRNVSKMKLYRYSYSQEYLDIAGVNIDPDTGVIAQEVQEVLPDAVKESVSSNSWW